MIHEVSEILEAFLKQPGLDPPLRDAAKARLVDEFLSIFGGRMQPVMAQLIEAVVHGFADARNAIKRQIYNVAVGFEPCLLQAAHVVRLRAAFDRKQFVSASSDLLKQAVRVELLQLFERATAPRKNSSLVPGTQP